MLSNTIASQLHQPAALDSPAGQAKLRHAASDFEAMLLSKWWSSMKDSGFGDSDQTDPGHDTLDQLGMQALSSAVAGAGGIGLGDMLVRGLLSNVARGNANDPSTKGS
jgi:Rod binding domain-containing protein